MSPVTKSEQTLEFILPFWTGKSHFLFLLTEETLSLSNSLSVYTNELPRAYTFLVLRMLGYKACVKA